MLQMAKKDPFSSLRIPEFRWFLAMRLFIVLAWSMQFVLIEWEVYRITKDPLSLGLIGLMEIIPAISMALFAGHIVDQNEKKGLLIKCFFGLATISALLCLLVHPNFLGCGHQKLLASCSQVPFLHLLCLLRL